MKSVKLMALFMLGAAVMSFTTIEKTTAAYQLNASPIKWKTEAVDLGEIPVGKPVTLEFDSLIIDICHRRNLLRCQEIVLDIIFL